MPAMPSQPRSTALWLGWFSAIAQHRDWPRASTILDRADAALGDPVAMYAARAFVAVESGDDAVARARLSAVPDAATLGAAPAGHLSLGALPPELGLDLEPCRTIAPEVGKLVLFPSTLWHGTLPYPAGERLNIAFDITPRQSVRH